MGAKRFKANQAAIKSAISKITGRTTNARSSVATDLTKKMIVKMAEHLLRSNRHLKHFEVELDDETTCQSIAQELSDQGCAVRRVPFKWRLEITCPEDSASPMAA